eukprot:m.337798 g.337798  ORF g.337798 m.337798 type:complete len:79 (+) comp18236_c0_seq1:126-362(+)
MGFTMFAQSIPFHHETNFLIVSKRVLRFSCGKKEMKSTCTYYLHVMRQTLPRELPKAAFQASVSPRHHHMENNQRKYC